MDSAFSGLAKNPRALRRHIVEHEIRSRPVRAARVRLGIEDGFPIGTKSDVTDGAKRVKILARFLVGSFHGFRAEDGDDA